MAPEPDTNAIPLPIHWDGVHPAMADYLMTPEQVAREAIEGIPNSARQQEFFSGSTYGDK